MELVFTFAPAFTARGSYKDLKQFLGNKAHRKSGGKSFVWPYLLNKKKIIIFLKSVGQFKNCITFAVPFKGNTIETKACFKNRRVHRHIETK